MKKLLALAILAALSFALGIALPAQARVAVSKRGNNNLKVDIDNATPGEIAVIKTVMEGKAAMSQGGGGSYPARQGYSSPRQSYSNPSYSPKYAPGGGQGYATQDYEEEWENSTEAYSYPQPQVYSQAAPQYGVAGSYPGYPVDTGSCYAPKPCPPVVIPSCPPPQYIPVPQCVPVPRPAPCPPPIAVPYNYSYGRGGCFPQGCGPGYGSCGPYGGGKKGGYYPGYSSGGCYGGSRGGYGGYGPGPVKYYGGFGGKDIKGGYGRKESYGGQGRGSSYSRGGYVSRGANPYMVRSSYGSSGPRPSSMNRSYTSRSMPSASYRGMPSSSSSRHMASSTGYRSPTIQKLPIQRSSSRSRSSSRR